ncbi:MAG: CCE_0567 family metalloprotein [Campylobacterales bacterium]|nr:CCE_0567 family metalloprotein [Campylobacterales bacterium]
MGLTEEQKEIKKEYAGLKRKVTEVAGEIHDIVEDTIWTDYDKLPALSEKIGELMKDVLAFKVNHDFLK